MEENFPENHAIYVRGTSSYKDYLSILFYLFKCNWFGFGLRTFTWRPL